MRTEIVFALCVLLIGLLAIEIGILLFDDDERRLK